MGDRGQRGKTETKGTADECFHLGRNAMECTGLIAFGRLETLYWQYVFVWQKILFGGPVGPRGVKLNWKGKVCVCGPLISVFGVELAK